MTSALDIPRVLIGGQEPPAVREVRAHRIWDGASIGRFGVCGPADLETAIAAASEASAQTKRLPAFERANILQRVARQISDNAAALAELISAQVGKPITFARGEVQRAIATFTIAAEESKRIGGDVIPLDLNEASVGRTGIVRRFPVGVVLGISPFNFPLNLVAHKLAPAMASGNAFLLKPSSNAPLPALMLGKFIIEAGYPAKAVNILPCAGEDAEKLVADERIGLVTFTGSAPVGWSIKAKAGKKKVVLELGGNAGVIVDRSADLEDAVPRLVTAAFAYAGQVCIKTQRIYVHSAIYDDFRSAFIERTEKVRAGDPSDDRTVVGPMIDDENASRVEQWVADAVKEGAVILTGGKRNGAVISPTVLEEVRDTSKVVCEEVFGPVVTLHRFTEFAEALNAVNASTFGLQAGVFTNDFSNAWKTFESLEVGGVIVNDASIYRIDHMPYGGVKASGFGREGIRYAIDSMTEPRLLAIRISGS